ncbi:uncharacterized protein ASCRUDRAFT_79516 [Ascoidea rubescens DSM 1968]|uniref:Uncharacterized protein n=1 Tax=Ascoidea rubescens DSM 1968 TaxID=1344418 RepID=A0A1D2VMR0_9ASCO|nr:hypothetical protein ASCRUDRAFT_79516 [Ascoidea rubescens DSM 1968]ODV62890.1 hypothetical protein ASCRUDRAFT_79516 [Ascoidea rubescens DSM 1968]
MNTLRVSSIATAARCYIKFSDVVKVASLIPQHLVQKKAANDIKRVGEKFKYSYTH